MNSKPICIASAAASFIVACALEGGGLTLWQAVAVLVPAMMLLVWSFCQTDWYDAMEGGEIDGSNRIFEKAGGDM